MGTMEMPMPEANESTDDDEGVRVQVDIPANAVTAP